MNAKELWRKLTWTWVPQSVLESGDAIVRNFWLHWFPANVSRRSMSFTYSLWLGTAAVVLFFILGITGLVLMFHYVPYPEAAYWSMKDLEFAIAYGRFLRNMHRIAAHLMVAVVFFHMARVFFTGAYKNGASVQANRPLNWLVGILLLLLTLFLSFTGYLLPWDQLAYWAITVGTNIARAAPLIGEKVRYILLGGNEIGRETLLRFYVLHCVVLPLALFVLFCYHGWRIRKDGGLACVEQDWLREEKRTRVITTEGLPAEAAGANPGPDRIEGLGAKTYSLLGIRRGMTVAVVESSVEEKDRLDSSPHLARRILLATLVTLTVVTILSVVTSAPLEEIANPTTPPNPAKAPWYFLWLQELVSITTIHLGEFTINGALLGGIVVPLVLVVLAALWPFWDKSPREAAGVWLHRSRRRQNLVFAAVALVVIVLIVIATYFRGPFWNFYWPWERMPVTPPYF